MGVDKEVMEHIENYVVALALREVMEIHCICRFAAPIQIELHLRKTY